jgi:hypothetical protein
VSVCVCERESVSVRETNEALRKTYS